MNDFDMFMVFTIIAGFMFGILIFLIVFWATRNKVNKDRFCKEYNIVLPHDSKVKIQKREYYLNYYVLSFPHWLYSNNDGTRNKRYGGNNLVFNMLSTLHFNEYIISSASPFVMLDIVNKIRELYGDSIIEMNIEETEKYQFLQSKAYNNRKVSNIEKLINEFSDNPYEFEEYCANLYEKMNYRVTRTSKSKDGGYDLLLNKDNDVLIAECKCYSVNNKIGRPLLQKLVGANQEIRANGMIFITTSDFTQEAKEYANRIGVELINGYKLLDLINKYLDDADSEIDIGKKWHLTEKDLKEYFPKDVIFYN